MRTHIKLAALLLLAAPAGFSIPARAHDGASHHHETAAACQSSALACASVATAAFAPDGKLWLTWSAGGRISVASSTDLGKTFSTPITLPATKLPLDDGPDARPKIAFGPNDRVVLSYAARDEKYNGHAFLARSSDGGKTFSEPQPITTGSPSQRFETAAFDPNGRVFAAWIDKRNVIAAKKAGKTYAGAALAYAWDDKPGGLLDAAAIARADKV